MHYRDTQTADGSANFIPKNHSGVLINGTSAITFKDRQGVQFVVNPSVSPTLLPFSVSEQVTASGDVIYLA
jgi:hypothetical protein